MIDQRLINNVIDYNIVIYIVQFETKTNLSKVMFKFLSIRI